MAHSHLKRGALCRCVRTEGPHGQDPSPCHSGRDRLVSGQIVTVPRSQVQAQVRRRRCPVRWGQNVGPEGGEDLGQGGWPRKKGRSWPALPLCIPEPHPSPGLPRPSHLAFPTS